MLKSSSLCLYSSNLGTFLLKIKQFWPFEEISIFSNGGHLGWKAGLSDTILKGTHPGTIPARRFKCDLIKICLICIIGINRLKEKFHRKTRNIC